MVNMLSVFWIQLLTSNAFRLVSMLICIAVVVCFFIHSYSTGSDINDKEKKIQKLHTFYVTGILVFIIIELVTAICMGTENYPDILSYVSFAATLSSLIMSVVAIIFTIVTSNRGNDQIKKLDNASDRISSTLDVFSEKATALDESVEAFKSTSEKLNEDLALVLNEIKDVKRMTFGLVEHQQQNEEDGKKKIANNKTLDLNKVAERMIAIGSFSGNIALFACAIAAEKGHPFRIAEVASNADDASYKFGYLIAACAVGIVSGQINLNECHIETVAPGLKELLEKNITQFIEKSEGGFKTANNEAYQKVLSYFNPL